MGISRDFYLNKSGIEHRRKSYLLFELSKKRLQRQNLADSYIIAISSLQNNARREEEHSVHK